MNATSYRLTADDEGRITDRLVDVTGGWNWHGAGPRDAGVDRLALQRIAAHSIGCSLDDLRDCEVEWINGRIERVLVEGH
jgi:hypothetical protein